MIKIKKYCYFKYFFVIILFVRKKIKEEKNEFII